MQNLPPPEVYEQFFTHTPWKKTFEKVLKEVMERTPPDGSVLDLMCGPGYLGQRFMARRPDLLYTGVVPITTVSCMQGKNIRQPSS